MNSRIDIHTNAGSTLYNLMTLTFDLFKAWRGSAMEYIADV